MVYYRNKQLARALNGVESGDEISANIGGNTYHGVVTTVFGDEVLEDNTPVELELDALEEGCINIVAEYVGEEGKFVNRSDAVRASVRKTLDMLDKIDERHGRIDSEEND